MRHILCLLLFAAGAAAQRRDELNFLRGLSEEQDLRAMLPVYLERQASALLEQRRRTVGGMTTLADVSRRREYLRQHMLSYLGGFPDRTPLNARTVGVLERDGYRIEKVIFESQPRFYVTANLYLPARGQPPYPAILYPLGHELGGKANPTWQQMLATLARRGFVALAWDPLGQGERSQFYDPDWQDSKLRGSTTEHTMLGTQCLLLGEHIARYTIWDGIRALDYLLSRKEVDPKRVGCTGNSGGGTHTAYLSALDDRIQAAAPSCYLTSWRALLKALGPQDAEQAFPLWLRDGIDFPDFIYAFAPKPYLILSAIRDFFPISGARATYEEARRIYSTIGPEGKLAMFEADDGHGYSKPRREAAYRWFTRWLKGVEDDQPEQEIRPERAEELNCTPTGQVATSSGGETVYSMNLRRLERIQAARPAWAILQSAREMSGFDAPRGDLHVRPYGAITKPDYRIEKLTYESEPGIRIPALLYIPQGASHKPAALYVDGRGKAVAHEQGEQIAKAGMVVLSIDARGLGETQAGTEANSSDFDRYFGDYKDAMTALMLGKPLVGMRARDISRGVDVLASRAEVDPGKIYGFGKGGGAVPMLYASALDDRLKRVALEGLLVSYESVVRGRIHRHIFEQIIPSALQHFDLPDLAAAIAPRSVWIVDAVNPLGLPVPLVEARKEYARAGRTVHVQQRRPGETAAETYREMLEPR